MLENTLILDHLRVLPIELIQAEEEGKDIEEWKNKVELLQKANIEEEEKEELAGQLLDQIYNLPIKPSYPYKEPSTWEEIQKLLPNFTYQPSPITYSKETLYNKIHGAWLGRCIGCLLGKPIEGWLREKIVSFLTDTQNYPIHSYLTSEVDAQIKEKYQIKDIDSVHGYRPQPVYWINKVKAMPEDDDLNYTITALHIVETYGLQFNSAQVAESWLLSLPLLSVFTAERIAYRNLSLHKFPPHSATYRNPYREWIGAQIRGDFWGYINPGNIKKAAHMAYRDASVSHVKNGIYGEIFVSAMLAAAWFSDDLEYIIECGLSEIPETSRLAEALHKVLRAKKAGRPSKEIIDIIHQQYNEKDIHHWCHVIPNAMIVCMALLYGNKDFDTSLSLAITSGFDTDCNAATVGSVLGLILGANQIDEKWTLPLQDKVESGVKGVEKTSISSLAYRTLDIINKKG